MHKNFIKLFFIFSLLWGIGYPYMFRYPLYISIAPFILITSNKFKYFKLSELTKYFSTLKKDIKFSRFFIVSIVVVLYFFYWTSYSFIYATSLLAFVFILRFFVKLEDIDDEDWIYKSIIIAIIIAGLSLPFFGSYSKIYYLETIRASNGLYPELSHLGFSLGPALGLLTKKKSFRIYGILGTIYFVIFSFSRTLIISYLFTLFLPKRFNNKLKSHHLATIIFCLLAFIYSIKGFLLLGLENIETSQINPIWGSSIVWFYRLKQSLSILITNPIGLGPFGWLTNGVDLSTRFMPECDFNVICKYSGKFLTSLNHRDLASLNSFGIASFGILYPYYLFLVLNNICKKTIKVSEKYYVLEPISILLISYIFIYMLRWTGFTAGPLLGLFCLMPKMVKKNKVD